MANNQAAFDPDAIPQGYAAREVRDRLIVARPEDEALLGTFLTRPFDDLALLPSAQRVPGGRAGPIHFSIPGATSRVFVRPYAHGGAVGGGRVFPDPGRAIAELATTAQAQTLELPVAPLIAATATRIGDRAWVMEAWSWWLPNATALSLALPPLAAMEAVKRDALKSVAAALRRCHEAGLRHADLNSRNVLVERVPDAWRVRVVDLDKASFGPPLGLDERLSQLQRLYRSLAKEGVIPAGLTPGEFGEFAHEATGGLLAEKAVPGFVARCRRSTAWHALRWRTAKLLKRLKPRRQAA